MGQNNFILDIIGALKKTASKKQIQSDAKNLGNIFVPLIGKLSPKSKTVSQIKKDLDGVEIPVNLTGKANKKGIVTSVQQATQQAQATANKDTIQVGMSLKKDKLINDIKVFGQQNTKLFKDANMAAKYNSLLDNAKLATSNKEIQNLRLQLSAMRSEIKAMNLSGLTLGDTFKKTFKRATELFTGTGGVMLLTQQLREALQEALNLDKAYTDLIKVQNELSRGDYPEYLEQCNKKAQELAATQQGLIEGVTEFSKSGYNLTTSNKLAEQSTILSNVGEMSASDSAKAIISGVQAYDVVDGYTDAVEKAQALIDKYNEIGNTASITTAEIAQGVQSVGSVFADANTSVDEFIALLAAGNRQFQDADSLALALRTTALRIRGCTVELEQMGEETDGVYTSASKLQEKINDLTSINGNDGVKILEADGETFRSIYDIFVDLDKVYKDMSDTDQSALLELISGKHRASAISATLNNMSEAQEIYQRSLSSTGSAQAEYDKYLQSSESSLNKFKASMTETYQSVINGNTTKGILDAGNATLQFVNSLGLVESTLKGLVAIGIVKAITTLSTAFKASAIQASNFGTALNTVKKMSSMTKDTKEYTNALNALKTVSVDLSETQLKQVLASKTLSDSNRIAILRATGLTKAQAQAKLAQMGLTQSTNAQTTANASATASTFSLTAAVKGFGASLKAAFMSNPVGISIMALSMIIGAVSSKVSEYNEKLRETRQANMDAATSAKEKADALRELYVQYENLSSITDRTSSQEEQFKQVVQDITKALGDKAEALSGLTAGTDDYTKSLREATKAELEGQYATAKIGAKAAEDELKDKTYSNWDGSHVTIQQNEQMTGVKEHVAALEAVKDILAEYEDEGTYGIEWEPVNWDKNKNDMNAVVEYYNALIEARDKLVTADNADFLMKSDIYENINTTINDLSESVEKYTEQQYQALKLNYEWQNGIPSTEEEFQKMEESILNASGAGKEFQEILKGYLAEDFSSFSNATSNIADFSEEVANKISTMFSYDKLEDIPQKLAEVENAYKTAQDALESYSEKGYYSMDVIDSILSLEDDYINVLVDENGQLQLNSDSMNKLAEIKIEAAKASIYQETCEELVRIKTLDTSLAAQELALVNGTLTESAYETAKALYEEVVAMGGANAALARNVWDSATKKVKLLDNQLTSLKNNDYSVDVSVSSSSASESAEDAASTFKSLMDDELEALDARMEAGLIKYDDYLKQRLALIESYKGKITDADYYSALADNYDNELSYMDMALNAVKRVIDEKIDAYNKEIEALEKAHDEKIKLIDEEIQKLEDQKEALQDENDAIERQLSLEQALYDLERAQTQRSKKVYTGDKGYVYKTDQDAIRDAQESVRQSKLDIQIAEIDDAIEKLQEQQEALEEKLEAEREAIEKNIEDLEEYQEKWEETTSKYKEDQENMVAAAMWGKDWENSILTDRQTKLEDFTNAYVTLQQRQAEAALAAAEAAEEAERRKASAESSGSGGTGGSGSQSQSLTKEEELEILYFLRDVTKQNVNINQSLDSTQNQEALKNVQKAIGVSETGKYDDTTYRRLKNVETYGYDSRIRMGIPTSWNFNARDIPIIKKYAKGGVISSSNSSGLDYLAKQFGEDRVVLVKDGERVLTPVQNEMWEKWTEALPNLQNLSNMIKVNVPDYSNLNNIVNRNTNQPITLSIGDIHLSNVQDVDTLSKAIVRELPSKVIQTISRR